MGDKHYTEEQLEALAEGLKAPEGDLHLQTCKRCAERFVFFQRFYRALTAEFTKTVEPKVESLAGNLSLTHVIELLPFQVRPDPEKIGLAQQTLLLAAQGAQRRDSSDVSVATYASEARKTLVRVVRKRDEPAYTIHVLSEDNELKEHVVLALVSRAGEARILATDSQGMTHFSSHSPIDWDSTKVLIFLPIASFLAQSGMISGTQLSDGTSAVTIMEKGDSVILQVQSRVDRIVRHVLLVYLDGTFILQDVVMNQVTLSTNAVVRIHKLLLFH